MTPTRVATLIITCLSCINIACESAIDDTGCAKQTDCAESQFCLVGRCIDRPCYADSCSSGCCDTMTGSCVPFAEQSDLRCGPAGEQCLACGAPGSFCDQRFHNCCQPTTCEVRGAECGMSSDGCGGLLVCGDCPESQRCSGDPLRCVDAACEPTTCVAEAKGCGSQYAKAVAEQIVK